MVPGTWGDHRPVSPRAPAARRRPWSLSLPPSPCDTPSPRTGSWELWAQDAGGGGHRQSQGAPGSSRSRVREHYGATNPPEAPHARPSKVLGPHRRWTRAWRGWHRPSGGSPAPSEHCSHSRPQSLWSSPVEPRGQRSAQDAPAGSQERSETRREQDQPDGSPTAQPSHRSSTHPSSLCAPPAHTGPQSPVKQQPMSHHRRGDPGNP